ncbi:MAG: PQQ-binding-like beta-propeller repeat protein [Dethiosulfatibacter sp.]|nr:PQQ-binding-like beta-propeller repeat protein [Dethiosulfatibacter sp.]
MKKMYKCIIVSALCLGLLAMTSCSAPKIEPMQKTEAMFRGNLSNTGVYNTKGVHELSELIWKYKTDSSIVSSPAIADGVVYIGSRDSYLYAIDSNTGQEKWKFKTDDMIDSSPAIADGVVYIGSMDSYLYAITKYNRT